MESEDPILNADHRLEAVVQEGQARGVHLHKKEILDAPEIAPVGSQAGCSPIDPDDEPGFTDDRLDRVPVSAAQVQSEVAGADMIERVCDPSSQTAPNRLKGGCVDHFNSFGRLPILIVILLTLRQDLCRFPDTFCP